MPNPVARAACGIASLLMLGVSSGAVAQEPIVWSDIDCALTKIVVPQGLRCRETNEAGTRGRATSTGIGVAKSWSAFGTVQQVKLYYHVHQVLSPRSRRAGQFTEVLRNLSSTPRRPRASAPTPRADADRDLRRARAKTASASASSVHRPAGVAGRSTPRAACRGARNLRYRHRPLRAAADFALIRLPADIVPGE